MHARELEPELERLLLRVVPDLDKRWRGADDHEIEHIEQLAGGPLPRCYKWFLARMGHDMGPLAFDSLDFSVAAVLRARAEKLFAEPHLLLIAYETNEAMPLHMLYDLSIRSLDDALVTKRHMRGGAFHPQFDGLRELLGWGALSKWRVGTSEQQCVGLLADEDGEVVSRLVPVMTSLGFTSPFVTGEHCSLFERADATLITSAIPNEPATRHIFRIGGRDRGVLRSVLGEIALLTSLRQVIHEWTPPLP
jgi:hypothetical protein